MYKEKIKSMLEKMNKQKDITIHSSYIFPPLSNDELTVLKKEFSIPKNLFDFFKEMNGFQVSYTAKSNKDFKKICLITRRDGTENCPERARLMRRP